MTRSRRSIYLTLGSFVVLVLTLTMTTCGGDNPPSHTPTSPSASAFNPNAGMVAGYGTCLFGIDTTSINVGPNGIDTGEIQLTVIEGTDPYIGPGDGIAGGDMACPWIVTSSFWILLKGVTTNVGNFYMVDGPNLSGYAPGSGTLKYHILHESLDEHAYWEAPGNPANHIDKLYPPDRDALDCTSYQNSDYTMNPETVDFDYAGGTGPTITVDVIPPKTREGMIIIAADTPGTTGGAEAGVKTLFTIPVTQTGSACEWYLKPANCTYAPNGVCTDAITLATPESDWISITGDGKGQGAGTANFSVSAGDVPSGSLAPRDGVITLYHVATQMAQAPSPWTGTWSGGDMPPAPPITPDISMGTLYINQLGEPANDDVPECSYNYAISQSVFEYPGGTAQLTIQASSQTCEWRINNWTVPGAWIHVSGCGQSCFGDQQLNVEVAPGDQYSPPVPRSSTIIIEKKVGGTFEQMFAVPISQVR